MSYYIVFIFITSFITVTKCGELCTKISACSCKNSEGVIDLSPLAKSDGPAFKDDPDPNNAKDYSWNPCKPFTEGDCKGAAACQTDTTTSQTVTIGTQDSAQFINDATEGLQIQYSSSRKTLYVTLKCQKEGEDKLDVTGENPPQSQLYYMTLTSVHACPGKGGGGGSEPFSVGYIVVIAFFGCFILYFIVGAMIQKFVRGASGAEIIPNYGFWSAIIGAIHGGLLFVFRCGKKGKVYESI